MHGGTNASVVSESSCLKRIDTFRFFPIELFQKRLRDAFFLRNVNIARVSAQLEIAEEFQLPVAELKVRLEDGRALAAVWEDHNEREAPRIHGSPTLVFDGGRAMLYGNVAETVIRATIDGLLAGIAPGSFALLRPRGKGAS